MKYKIYRTAHGLRVESEINIAPNQFLAFATMKRHSGAAATTARIEKEEGDFRTWGALDWSKTLATAKIRATEKALTAMHTQAVGEFCNTDEYTQIIEKGAAQ